jgi:hypothetical protein
LCFISATPVQVFDESENIVSDRRTAHSTYRQWMIQDAQLRQHRRLIPVSMLVGDFAAIELDENGDDEFGLSPYRSYG